MGTFVAADGALSNGPCVVVDTVAVEVRDDVIDVVGMGRVRQGDCFLDVVLVAVAARDGLLGATTASLGCGLAIDVVETDTV